MHLLYTNTVLVLKSKLRNLLKSKNILGANDVGSRD